MYKFVLNHTDLSNLDEISKYVNHLSFDLKAEMLVAVLAEHRVDLTEILTACDGQLKRDWSRDIALSSVNHLETGDTMLLLHLNRDGIYDVLPEALFHSNFDDKDQSGAEMAKDSMKLRAEEKEARMFFQPFENEIFLQRVQLTFIENQLFKSIYSDFLLGIIPYFWKTDNDLPESYVDHMKKLLPLVHRITGDITLTARCLEFILREKVNTTTSDEEQIDDLSVNDFQYSGVLGKSLLGVDTISGNHVSGFIKRLIFQIGPIINRETIDHLKDGSMNRFLDCFYGYFIPFEFDVKTKYIFGTEKNQFMLNDNTDTTISYLGYNSVLQ